MPRKLGYATPATLGQLVKQQPRTPASARITLDGANPSRAVLIPAGASVVMLNPLTITVDVQVSFNVGDANRTGRFITLIDGQSLELRTNSGETFGDINLQFFASAAVDVDVVVF